MRRLALAAAFASLAAAASAGGIEGIFQTQPDDDGRVGMVQFAPCGERYCGTLVKSFEKDGKPFKSANQGRQIVWDMQDLGGGNFGNGKVWQPSTGKTYSAKMSLAGSRLTLKGCVGPFCRSQVWTRAK